MEQAHNIILLGLLDLGEIFIAAGLGLHAVYSGYKISFISRGDLVHVLKTQGIIRSSQTGLKRITASDLIIIDDLVFLDMDHHNVIYSFSRLTSYMANSQ